MKCIEGINIHNLEVVLVGDVDRNLIDIGALTLSAEGREFILDVSQSYSDGVETTGDGTTRITCDLEVDEETFSECKYDFTKEDLLNGYDRDMTLFLGSEDIDFTVKSITLHFDDCNGQDYQLQVNEE
jgi:hypothetical protein